MAEFCGSVKRAFLKQQGISDLITFQEAPFTEELISYALLFHDISHQVEKSPLFKIFH
jgi:hypothetical protein